MVGNCLLAQVASWQKARLPTSNNDPIYLIFAFHAVAFHLCTAVGMHHMCSGIRFQNRFEVNVYLLAVDLLQTRCSLVFPLRIRRIPSRELLHIPHVTKSCPNIADQKKDEGAQACREKH